MGVRYRQERIAAQEAGAAYYFTGKPCKHGHVAERYTNTATCVECARQRAQRHKQQDPERAQRVYRAWRDSNADAIRQKKRESWAAQRAAGVPRTPAAPERRQVESRRYYEKHRDEISARVQASRERFRGRDNAISRTKKERKRRAVPPWADPVQIRAIYDEAARLGLHVDHDIPLRNPLVCGLHVQDNLRPLTPRENMRKKNRFDPAEFDWKSGDPHAPGSRRIRPHHP
jgi:hypothetical protein